MLKVRIYTNYLEISGKPSEVPKLLQEIESGFDLNRRGVAYHMYNAINSNREVLTLKFEGNKGVLYDVLNFITYYTYDYDLR